MSMSSARAFGSVHSLPAIQRRPRGCEGVAHEEHDGREIMPVHQHIDRYHTPDATDVSPFGRARRPRR